MSANRSWSSARWSLAARSAWLGLARARSKSRDHSAFSLFSLLLDQRRAPCTGWKRVVARTLFEPEGGTSSRPNTECVHVSDGIGRLEFSSRIDRRSFSRTRSFAGRTANGRATLSARVILDVGRTDGRTVAYIDTAPLTPPLGGRDVEALSRWNPRNIVSDSTRRDSRNFGTVPSRLISSAVPSDLQRIVSWNRRRTDRVCGPRVN